MDCVVCGSAERSFLYHWVDGWQVHRCADCGLLYTDPCPDAAYLAEYYQGFHRALSESHEKFLPLVQSAVERYVSIAEELAGPVRSVLDAQPPWKREVPG